MDEYLDLVDAQDQVIGKKLRSEIQAENLHNFRVINAFIVNSKGELWIPRRTATKRIFPLAFDMSVGGHVESGESYDDTFKRETMEELNINVDQVKYRLLGKLTPEDGVSSYMQVYEISLDEAPNYNPDDFVEYFWLTPAEVLKRIEEGEKTKTDLPTLIKKFYNT
ncbi:MAG: NUDIX hydrolase [Candidatus Pacebacteria bacterium]|nr:NUDIX hydrolase [Candidatus Paceibacterota bacterium]